jgi:hypothetical protein
VCFAGLASGDGTALVLISHDGVSRGEVLDVLRRRWPEVAVKTLEQEAPTVAMSAECAADLGHCHRATEPLRIIILPQRDPQPAIPPVIEPMPVII